jgi:hypothetical protein
VCWPELLVIAGPIAVTTSISALRRLTHSAWSSACRGVSTGMSGSPFGPDTATAACCRITRRERSV